MGPLPRINASGVVGGGGGGGGSLVLGPAGPALDVWRPYRQTICISHFPGLNITPSDIESFGRFPPRVAGLFRTQRAHACKNIYEDTHAKELPYV